jgi:putative FmdB family regulatory protein
VPVYEYNCSSCQAAFEQLVRSMNGRQRVTCPECGSVKVARRLSMFAARQSSGPRGQSAPAPSTGACGRCGDPNGPCSA